MAHTAAAFLADDEEQRASIFFMFTSKWHMDKWIRPPHNSRYYAGRLGFLPI